MDVDGSDSGVYVWRKPGEEKKTKNPKPRVLVWGWFSISGVGEFVLTDGIRNDEGYRATWDSNLPKSAKELLKPQKWVFQLDNDPKLTSRIYLVIYLLMAKKCN